MLAGRRLNEQVDQLQLRQRRTGRVNYTFETGKPFQEMAALFIRAIRARVIRKDNSNWVVFSRHVQIYFSAMIAAGVILFYLWVLYTIGYIGYELTNVIINFLFEGK